MRRSRDGSKELCHELALATTANTSLTAGLDLSYPMIGASFAPSLLAAFFWKPVTCIAGVLSIPAGMVTVVVIALLNSTYKDGRAAILSITFPMDTDYIAIPAVIVSVTTAPRLPRLEPESCIKVRQRPVGPKGGNDGST